MVQIFALSIVVSTASNHDVDQIDRYKLRLLSSLRLISRTTSLQHPSHQIQPILILLSGGRDPHQQPRWSVLCEIRIRPHTRTGCLLYTDMFFGHLTVKFVGRGQPLILANSGQSQELHLWLQRHWSFPEFICEIHLKTEHHQGKRNCSKGKPTWVACQIEE